MIELERTFLAKYLPEDLEMCTKKEVFDKYIPKSTPHPVLRIRKNGNTYEMTKKQPVHGQDSSEQEEQTIHLTDSEFDVLRKLDGKEVRKIRHYYNYKGRTAEIDVFQDALQGLVLVDFEFERSEEKNAFQIPDFCLADVTLEKFTAGGMLCGKSYEDIKKELEKYKYKKL